MRTAQVVAGSKECFSLLNDEINFEPLYVAFHNRARAHAFGLSHTRARAHALMAPLKLSRARPRPVSRASEPTPAGGKRRHDF